MSLVYDKSVPSTVLPAALQALSSLSAVPDARGGQSPLSGLSVSHVPLPVYSLPLDGLGESSVFKDAKPVSWRVFVVDGRDEPVAAAEVVVPPGGGTSGPLPGLHAGPTGDLVGPGALGCGGTGRRGPLRAEIPGNPRPRCHRRLAEKPGRKRGPDHPGRSRSAVSSHEGRVYPIGIPRSRAAGRLQASPVRRRSFVQG